MGSLEKGIQQFKSHRSNYPEDIADAAAMIWPEDFADDLPQSPNALPDNSHPESVPDKPAEISESQSSAVPAQMGYVGPVVPVSGKSGIMHDATLLLLGAIVALGSIVVYRMVDAQKAVDIPLFAEKTLSSVVKTRPLPVSSDTQIDHPSAVAPVKAENKKVILKEKPIPVLAFVAPEKKIKSEIVTKAAGPSKKNTVVASQTKPITKKSKQVKVAQLNGDKRYQNGIRSGWDLFKKGEGEEALATWQRVVSKVDGSQFILIGGVYSEYDIARSKLDLFSPDQGVVLSPGNFKGMQAYYLLSIVSPNAIYSGKSYFSEKLGIPRAFANDADSLRSRMWGAAAPYPVRETSVKDKPLPKIGIVEKKAPTSSKKAAKSEGRGTEAVVKPVRSMLPVSAVPILENAAPAVASSTPVLEQLLYAQKNMPKNSELNQWIEDVKQGQMDANTARKKLSAYWLSFAITAQRQGDHDNALRFLNIASTVESNHPKLALNLAYSKDATGKAEEASAFYQKFIDLTNVSWRQYKGERRYAESRIAEITASER